MSTIDNILGSVSNEQNHIAQIEANLFQVEKVQLCPNLEGFVKPDIYGVYKSNGGQPLGVMGKDFVPMQPKEFLDNIIQTVHECGANLDLSTLKFEEFQGGSMIEFRVKMHPISFKNNKGIKDVTNMELTFSTSYNGKKSSRITLYTERLVCLNGMTALKIEGELRGKNTIGGKAKILSYCQEVADIINGAEGFKQKMIELDKVKPTKEEIEQFKLKLLGFNRETLLSSDKVETKKFNILEKIEESIAMEFERTGETAFGLLQGVTYYTNHVANSSKTISDAEYIRFYQGAKLNDKAQELLFAELN